MSFMLIKKKAIIKNDILTGIKVAGFIDFSTKEFE